MHGHRTDRPSASGLTICGTLLSLLLFTGTCRTKKTWPKSFSQEELKKRLSPIQFHVTQEKGTESAFRGEYTEYKEDGIYTCVVCGSPLFKSETKFDSGSGRFDAANVLTLTRYFMTSSDTDQPPHKSRQRRGRVTLSCFTSLASWQNTW
ncbi:methionine-R-sulfoxide reductase B3 isoform X2 [Oncorhynchus nerka]|uniref:methionine-R-sulfoxide reductase B3 isoform X2 n=1 Tax=Oncorhynchus nerka TaxID=8023 RepID=UPI0031B81932